jgi:hypothetical protein
MPARADLSEIAKGIPLAVTLVAMAAIAASFPV